MPYLRFELDAVPHVPNAARAASVAEGVIAWGLLQMWEFCWRAKTTTVTQTQVRGFFGCLPTEALIAFGFLEQEGPDRFRVCGAEKYLRVSRAQSAGGHAAKGNLRRGNQPPTPPESPPAIAGDQPGKSPGTPPGLTASSEQRAVEQRAAKGEEADPEEAEEQRYKAAKAVLDAGKKAVAALAAGRDPGPPPSLGVGVLRDLMGAAWFDARGVAFDWSLEEERAVAAALGKAKGDEAEVLRRWRNALAFTSFPLCGGVKDLVRHWNPYGAAQPVRRSGDPHKSPVRAEDVPRESFNQTGDVTRDF